MPYPAQPPPSYVAPAPPPARTSPAHVWDYWAVVMKRAAWVVPFLAICLGIAFVVTKRQQQLYRATARIELTPPALLGRGDAMFAPTILSDEMYLATQLQKLQEGTTVQKAVEDRQLAKLADFGGKTAAEITRLALGNVEVNRRRGTYFVDVAVVGPDPRVLDDLANALVETFRDMQRSETKQAKEDTKARMEDKIAGLDARIRMLDYDKRTALEGANFTETTFDSEYQRIFASRERYCQERDDVHRQILREERDYQRFVEARADAAKGLASLAQHTRVLLHPKIKEITNEIGALRDEQRWLLDRGIGRANPEFEEVERKIGLKEKEREAALADFVDTFILEFEDAKTRLSGLEREIERITADLKSAAQVKQTVDEKNAQILRLVEDKQTANHVLEQVTASALEEKDTVRIVARASEPSMPYSPNTTTNMVLGGVFGVVGGIALAFLLEYLDDTIHTKDELAKVADVPLLGIVPNIEGRKSDLPRKDLYAHGQPKSTIAEAFRGVRTSLTLGGRAGETRTMVLTSAGPREGKTTTAINLATVLGYAGTRTLLVDADLRKPRIHKSFDLPNTKGLTNLIVGEEDPLPLCQPTHVKNVDVLVSGPIPPNPSELLGRPRMREILACLKEHYDAVVLDTPPIGAVTDAAVLATYADGVILVVHAGRTRRQIVSRGLEQLRYINARVVGVILNNLRLGRSRYYPGYYHYYYYYASHYGAEDDKRAAKKKAKAPAGAAAGAGGDGASTS